jgi:hypothetical protein
MLKVLFYAIPVVLAIYAIIDCLQTPDEQIQGLPRLGWLVLIVFFLVIGPAAWLIAGRTRDDVPRSRLAWPPGPTSGAPDQQRPTRRFSAPDDDPEFLSQLGRDHPSHGKNEQDAMLEEWERDLRRRESDLRGDGSDPGPGNGPDEGEPGGSPAPRV